MGLSHLTRSRNRRVVRVVTTRRSQVKVAEAANAASMANNMAVLPAKSASAIRLSHRAINASGTAWSKVSVTTTTTRRGSWVIRACTAATSMRVPAGARRGRTETGGRSVQLSRQRTSKTTPSSSIVASNLFAWSSNIVL